MADEGATGGESGVLNAKLTRRKLQHDVELLSNRVERLREEFEEEEAEIRAKSTREQESRAKALRERERKRAEHRAKLEEELAARESERHKQVIKLKEVLKEHSDAKKRIAEEDAPT